MKSKYCETALSDEALIFSDFDPSTVIYVSNFKNIFIKRIAKRALQGLTDEKLAEIYLLFVVDYAWKPSLLL